MITYYKINTMNYLYKLLLSILLGLSSLGIMMPSIIEVQAIEDNALLDDLYSDYGYIEDIETGEVLASKEADTEMAPASMTKIMTIVVAVEQASSLDERVTITDDMVYGPLEEDASMAGFLPGDSVSVKDLLYGAALPSGADACHALAEYFGGSLSGFADLMNQKAAELGMNHSHFVNPTGLDAYDHYSTCKDIATLLKYAIQNETVATILSTSSYVTDSLYSHPAGLELQSSLFKSASQLGYSLSGVQGGKTGYTLAAGHCLAYWCDKENIRLVIVTAHAMTDSWTASHIYDAETIANRLEGWHRETIIEKDSKIASITVHHRFKDEIVDVYAPETITEDLPPIEVNTVIDFPTEVDAKLHTHFEKGTIAIYQDDNMIYFREIIVDIPRESNVLWRFGYWVQSLFGKEV